MTGSSWLIGVETVWSYKGIGGYCYICGYCCCICYCYIWASLISLLMLELDCDIYKICSFCFVMYELRLFVTLGLRTG